ncbi:hypothetical protein Tco_0960723, partial [Tanacetum coccineum]
EPAKKPKRVEKSAPAKEDVSSKKPSRKKSAGVVIRDTPGVFVSKKKAPAKVDRGKGMDLLSDVALLEATQLKKVLKRSKQDTHMLYASVLDDGVERGDDDDSNNDDNDDDNDDDEEENQDDEYVHTPEHYVPTKDETNDESDYVTEEEYERINEELYGDVNVSLTDAEPADKEKDDEEMTVDVHVNINQEGAGNQVKDDAQATHKTEGPILSSSISSDYDAKYLNFDNIPPVDVEVVSMLDINVQHEVPRTSPLLTIPVFIIPEHTVVNPPEIVTTASLTIISSLLSLLFPHLQQLTPIPTPTTTEATTSITVVSESETLAAFHQRITNLEKDVKEFKIFDHSTALLSIIKFEVPNAVKEYLGTSMDDALYKVLKKHDVDTILEHSVPAEIIKRLKQQYVPEKSTKDIRKIKMDHARNPKQRALYHALMESILEDEDAMDEEVADKLKKRKQDDADKDEGPFAGSDRGLKRRKTSKDTEPSKKAKSTETSKGTSKSQLKSTVKSAQAEETTALKHDWFKKPERPPTLDSDWNVRKSIDFRPPQTWINKITQVEKPTLSFDEIMSTPIDFSTYVMIHLKIDNLTQEYLVGPAFNLLKGTCKSHVELKYNIEECYKVVTDRLDWNNPKGKEYPFDLRKPLPLIMERGCQVVPVDYFINNDLGYLRGGGSSKKYTTSTTKTRAAKYDIPDIEDMVPLLWSPVKVAYDRYAVWGISH